MNRKRFWLQECQGTVGIQHRESSFRGEGPVTFLLFVHLFSGYWCGDFFVPAPLLDSLSLPPWFYNSSTIYLPVLMSWSCNTYWNWVEPIPQKDRTEQNRNNDMESFWGARTMWYITPDYLLPCAKGFEMNNVQTEQNHQIYNQVCHWLKEWKTNFSTT